jgi:TP901 family phage tail tape measure protein
VAVLTSKLILELIDRITGPSRAVAASLNKITALQHKNAAMVAATSQKLFVAAAAAYGLAKSLQAPVSAAANFETALLNIGQKADLSDESIASMGKRIRALAPVVNQTALDVAKGIDTLIGFGLDPDRAETLIKPIGKAATAYQAQVDDLAKAGFSALDNLKLKAEDFGKALDVMAQSGKEGAFELKDMAAQFPSLTASAQALGMTGVTAVGRLSAALQIARKGASDGSEAANNTMNLMQKIISPDTTKKFKELGVDIRKELKKTQAAGGDVFEMIGRETWKALKGDLSKIGDLFQDAQVQKFLRPLIQNMKEYRKIRDKALGATGVVDNDFARRMMTNAAQTEAFKIQVNDLSMTIGNILLPSVNRLMAAISPVIKSFEQFAGAHPQLVTGITAVTAGALALRIAFLGLKLAFGWLAGGVLMALRVALLGVGTALGPIGLAIGLVATYAVTHWQEVLALWQRLKEPWQGLGDTIAATWEMIAAPMRSTLNEIVVAVQALPGRIKAAATGLYEAGAALIAQLWDGMKSKVQALLGWVSGIGAKIKGALSFGGGGAAAGGAPAVAGARAAGGPVRAGLPYLVGERGPELFRPPQSGAISSAAETVRLIKQNALVGAAGQAGAGGSVSNTVTINVQAVPGQSAEAIAEAVERRFSAKLNALSRGAYSDGTN